MLKLILNLLQDPETLKQNLQRIQDEHDKNPLLAGDTQVREYTFGGAVSHQKIPHLLGFQPQDVLVTKKTGAGDLTIHYDKTDRTNLEFTTTGPCVVRLLVGTFGG